MLAARRPVGLRGVVLHASFVRFPLPVPERWRGAVRPWMFRLQPQFLMPFALLRWYLWRHLRAAVRSVSPEVLAARARAVAGLDVTAELRNCAVPLLYLRAAGDWVVRPGCWELVRSDAKVVVLPGPHLVLQVAPAESAALLASFCDPVSAPNN